VKVFKGSGKEVANKANYPSKSINQMRILPSILENQKLTFIRER
jgi:hypothetical protein